ncbi:hypothetical protein A2635_00270 [Candidatus Peribacteria bacterium RIFCSPHIGHO2_01_FULL_51_9]|nr:MAG: hypothetical protein A2635_00270 [Candidatus Peribacteria bacterium RIFCSPHIGHO2_01_FULL_51_9]
MATKSRTEILQELEDKYGMTDEMRLHRAKVDFAAGVRIPSKLRTILELSPHLELSLQEKRSKPQPPVEPTPSNLLH